MKKRILIMMAALMAVVLTATAQVYDGITQPTRFRIWLPVTAPLHGHGTTAVAPFMGYKQDLGERLSVTGIAQYNIKSETFIPQVWVNFNIAKTFYVLSRSIYNTKSGDYSHTMSATYKLPYGFMVDSTWDNLYNGSKFCDTDRLQFLGGWAHGKIVANAGYSVRHQKGFVANLRIKVASLDWLQLKYDGGQKSVQASMALQFN